MFVRLKSIFFYITSTAHSLNVSKIKTLQPKLVSCYYQQCRTNGFKVLYFIVLESRDVTTNFFTTFMRRYGGRHLLYISYKTCCPSCFRIRLEAPICSFANFAVLPPENSKYFISASIDDYVLHSVERKNA